MVDLHTRTDIVEHFVRDVLPRLREKIRAGRPLRAVNVSTDAGLTPDGKTYMESLVRQAVDDLNAQ